MTKKKNGFFTFVFSLIPGAGEMYMGFMKQGVSIMAAFWLLIFFAAFLNMGPVLFILPILWCYSFFNVHNLRGMTDEEFYAVEDDYAFHLDKMLPAEKWNKKQSKFLAVLLILIGIGLLWNNLVSWIDWLLPDAFYWFLRDDIPQMVVAVLLIAGGIMLIKGKKRELDKTELDKIEEQKGV